MKTFAYGLAAVLLLLCLPATHAVPPTGSAPPSAELPLFPSCTQLPRDYAGPSSTHNYCVTTGGSDYYVDFTYENLSLARSVCNCRQDDKLLVVARNSFRSGSNYFIHRPGLDTRSGVVQYGWAPGQSGDFYARTVYTGRKTITTCLTDFTCYEETKGDNDGDFGAITGGTDALYAPKNVSATEGAASDRITITWEKGTDVPDGLHTYRIVRTGGPGGTQTRFASGFARSFTDDQLPTNTTFKYTVSTYYDRSGVQATAAAATVEGSTFSLDFTASDGTKYNSTVLKWTSMARIAEEIRIERSVPGGVREELAVLSKNARGYNDLDGIPGLEYVYYITPINSIIQPQSDPGYSRPNGVIKGTVKSQLGAGVAGVDITVELTTTIPVGGAALPASCVDTYCGTTDENGYYEIRDVYYHEAAKFTVTPEKLGTTPHVFSPVRQQRTLDLTSKEASNVDFTDLTVFTVAGTVAYPQSSNNVTCGLAGVTILINGENLGVMTDNQGQWAFALQDEGTYSFRPDFLHHAFENAAGIDSTVAVIRADRVDLDFTNVETDSLTITAQGGCNSSLGEGVVVRVTSPNNCYNEEHTLDVNGVKTIYDLPARVYEVEVIRILGDRNDRTTILDQIGLKRQRIDLTLRDTADIITVNELTVITPEVTRRLPNDSTIVITPADTVLAGSMDTVRGAVDPRVSFIYRSPLQIATDFAEAGAEVTNCQNSEGDNIVVMEQGESYILQFSVKELLGADCNVDTGFLVVYDFISDREKTPVRIPIRNGLAFYQVDAGEPVIASNPDFHDHEKLLYVIPEVDLLAPVPLEYWVLVEGTRSITPTFFTRSPEIPFLILHDPPGDQSYSYVEEGTTISNFSTTEYYNGGDIGTYGDVVFGTYLKAIFIEGGSGVQIKWNIKGGRDNFNRSGRSSEITFLNRFSTSDLENLTGGDGDVYVGAAFNQAYANSDRLTFDNCTATINSTLSLINEEFATTFFYTELHIRNTLIPTFGDLRERVRANRAVSELSLVELQEYETLRADSLLWVQILEKNDSSRSEGAEFVENVSFSAGAPISRTRTSESTSSTSYEYSTFFESEFALGLKIKALGGGWAESELGIMGGFRHRTTTDTGNDTARVRTVGYVLDDNDLGDFLSVDILQDNSYNVPAFLLKNGTTSCPQEVGSQARDRPKMQIIPPRRTDVPAGGTANFTCQVTNNSESGETREYHVRVVSTTNPHGAEVSLGGFQINNKPASFFLPAGETANLSLSVREGPLASQYDGIGIMVYAPCEYELWQDNGVLQNVDTAYIDVNFETECTNVTLRNPLNNWLINRNSPDAMQVTFSGYDLNNESFEELRVEIKQRGAGFRPVGPPIPITALEGANYDLDLDLSNFPDGNYVLRARAFCDDGTRASVTYSSELSGTIDRTSLAPFGYPTPGDGFLRPGQAVSVTFDKDVDCGFPGAGYAPVVTLTRLDTDADIPVTAQCSGNRVILDPGTPLTDRADLAGVDVRAHVSGLRDLSGNVQKYPTVWTFQVNAAPVNWEPSPIYYAGPAGQPHTVTGVLKNNSLLSKSFSLDLQEASGRVSYPVWLRPGQINGTILPNDDSEIHFTVDPELSPGIYTGDIIAVVDGEAISTPVTVELLATPVNWPFNAADYEYSMTVVANFSLDGTDNLLSEDERDLVGAFVDGEIRGVTNIEYLPTTDQYRAFLTVYSHSPGGNNGEEIHFRFWHALNGVEYGALETVTFVAETNRGTPAAPLILHPEGIFQVIPLHVGWNWISLNVQTGDMSREHLLNSLVGDLTPNDVTIKSQDNMSVHEAGKSWNGNLKTLALGTGYLLHLSTAPDTLKVVGLPSPDPIEVAVTRRWNWLGYPQLEPRAVNDVLAGLNASRGDVLKGRERFSLFDAPATGWLGNLGQFVPGAGYKLHAARNGSITYPAPKRSGYEVEPGNYEHSMSVVGTFDLGQLGEDAYKPLDVVALVGGACRGIAALEYCEDVQGYRTFLLVYGSAADFDAPVEFRIVNADTRLEYLADGEPIVFGPDRLTGSVSVPYPYLGLSTPTYDPVPVGYRLTGSIPNPAADLTHLGFRLPVAEAVKIELYDIDGRWVRTVAARRFAAGDHTVPLDVSELAAGVYFYHFSSPGFSGSRKLIVR